MIITRKTKVPLHWTFYAQLPLLLSIYGSFVLNTPFLFLIKRFIDNPAFIMGIISLEFYLTLVGGPFMAWLSDRIWTPFGRRKFFLVFADVGRAFCLIAMPFSPNLIMLIVYRMLFSFFDNFGSMSQALIYEVVPPPQRGRLSAFFISSVQLGNIVFYFLLLGRFDDLYFMGPFASVMEFNGGSALFWIAALVLFGIAAFEGMGIKEIKPPDGKTINEGRKPGDSLFTHFLFSIFKDVFAKDFMPLYLLVFINIMFGVSLGILAPLLYTEQWGYSLQEMGNTMAIGALFSITFAMFAGWFADRFGKMLTFIIASAGSLVMNLFFAIYVMFQPDNRPSLTEIVVIGNITQAFMMIKGVVSFPLMMEYVSRSRMGAANAGIVLANNVAKYLLTLFVGIWLVWWSIWFFPQAGNNVSATFPEEIDESALREKIEAAGVPTEDLILEPLHQYGIDGKTSMRWWIHENSKQTHKLLVERKELSNKLSNEETKVESPFLGEGERAELQAGIDELKTRLDEIAASLEGDLNDLRARVLPALAGHGFEPGSQIRAAAFDSGALQLQLQSIEALDPDLIQRLEQSLEGPQYAVTANQEKGASSRWKSDISIESFQDAGPNVSATLVFDEGFLAVYDPLYAATGDSRLAFEAGAIITSLQQAELGKGEQQFSLSGSEASRAGDTLTLSYELAFSDTALKRDASLIAAALQQESLFKTVTAEELAPNKSRLTLVLENWEEAGSRDALEQARIKEVHLRLAGLLPEEAKSHGLIAETYLRLAETLESNPFYVTIPESTPRGSYREREYEYFYSSKLLEISTDIFGFVVIALIIYLERRGVIHKYGIEEDEGR